MSIENTVPRPFILGVSGGSGSGKTTFAKRLQSRLGSEQCSIVAQDNYYYDQSERFDGDGGAVNFDHPNAIDFDLLAAHLEVLKRALQVEVPIYDFSTHKRLQETRHQKPTPVIIVDGILLLSQENVRKHFNASVFVDVPEKLRFERRLNRDVKERGRTPEGGKKQFESQVKPMHDLYVEPSKVYATNQIRSLDEFDNMLEYYVKLLS
jgi:uridine kinase